MLVSHVKMISSSYSHCESVVDAVLDNRKTMIGLGKPQSGGKNNRQGAWRGRSAWEPLRERTIVQRVWLVLLIL